MSKKSRRSRAPRPPVAPASSALAASLSQPARTSSRPPSAPPASPDEAASAIVQPPPAAAVPADLAFALVRPRAPSDPALAGTTPAPPAVVTAAREVPAEPAPEEISTAPAAEEGEPATEREDEVSIPPAGDLSPIPPEGVEHPFFNAPHRTSQPSFGDIDFRDPRYVRLMSASARARRAELTRYVKGAVAVAGVLCLVALARVGLHLDGPGHDGEGSLVAQASGSLPSLTGAVVPTEAPPAQPSTPAASPVTAAAVLPTPAPPVPSVAPPDPKTLLARKQDARNALDRNQPARAIEAGEAIVAADPSDAEAWLLLGAAYQQQGNWDSARRAFASCLRQGRRGPIGECRAMLR